MKDALELAARYLTTLRAVEQAHMLGDEDALISILASVDPIDVQECANELRALSAVPDYDSHEVLIAQGRCPYCGWRTVVSGPGQVCGSCVRRRQRDSYEPTPRNVVHVGDVWSRRV